MAAVGGLVMALVTSRVPDRAEVLADEKTLLPNALPSALRDGVSMTSSLLLKDTSHRTVFNVWSNDAGQGAGDLVGRTSGGVRG